MNKTANDPLEIVIHESGEDWLIKWFAPREAALANIRNRLTQANDAAHRRFGEHAVAITDGALVELHRRDANKARAFLQALGSIETPEILVMVWRILAGHTIESIQLRYELKETFTLRIVLRDPDEETAESYNSSNIDDVAVLRHLSVMKLGDAPIFDGFYPLNI